MGYKHPESEGMESFFEDDVEIVKRIEDSYGGAVWSIATCDKQDGYIAAACDDGTLKLFDISNNILKYYRTFPKVEGIPFTLTN
jgi:hypothetical protein